MKALLLIDIQNDFLPGGSLAVPNGDEVIPVANAAMGQFDLVVASQDWHPAGHGSFASQHPGRNVGEVAKLADLDQVLWPDHCVQGTSGAELPESLSAEGIDEVIRKGTDPNIDSYSAFFDNARRRSTGLDDLLKRHGVTELAVMGLATDYCVKFTVLAAIDLGYRVTVVAAGCRGVELTPGDVDKAIEEMRQAGATIP